MEADSGAGTEFAGDFESTADEVGAFAHSGEAVVSGGRACAVAGLEAAAVVANDEGKFGGSVFELDRKMFGSGVFFDVVDGLLADAEDFALGAGRHGAVCAVEAEGGFEAVAVGVLGGAAELDGECVLAGVLRAEGPDGLARFGEAFADVLARGVEMADGGVRLVVAEKFGEDFKLDGDADVSLGEGVVDFAGDSVAFGEDGVEFALRAEEAEGLGYLK